MYSNGKCVPSPLPQNLQQIHPCQGELEKKNIVKFKGTVNVISSESL